MGISDGTSVLTPAQKTLAAQAEILAQTSDAEGDAARTADSAANQQRKMAASVEDAKVALGTALLPVIQAILPIITKLATLFEKHADVLVPLAGAIGAVVIAQWAWNAAMAANPIGLIVIGIAAIIAGIVLLIQNWDTVKAVAEKVWNAILSAITFVWDWIKANWPLLLAIITGPFGIAVYLITKNFDTIKSLIGDAINFVKGIIDGLISFFTGIPGRIKDALSGLLDIIKAPFVDAVNAAKGIWNEFARAFNRFSVPIPEIDTHIPGVGKIGGGTLKFPNLPILARGGIVTGPTLALLLGEAGREAVVPLDRGGGLGGNTYNLNVSVAAGADPAQTGRTIVDLIAAYERANGRGWREAS